MASWVTRCQSDTPTSSPSCALRSSIPLTVSMAGVYVTPGSQPGEDHRDGAQREEGADERERGDEARGEPGRLPLPHGALDHALPPAGEAEEDDGEERVGGAEDHERPALAAHELRDHGADPHRRGRRRYPGAPPGQPGALGREVRAPDVV